MMKKPLRTKKRIGQVTHAYWDEKLKAIRFTITFDQWGVKLQGTCHSGLDKKTGTYVSPAELKEKTKQFINMAVYDDSGEYSTNEKPSYEKLKKIRFNISIKSMKIGVSPGNYKPGINAFLRRLLG